MNVPESAATVEERFTFLDEIQELPSLPQVVMGVSRVASDPSSNAADLADLILKDQALTLKLLRIANSAQYALCSQRITTVSRAVVLLGFESVRAITLGLGAYQLLSALKKGGGILERFWTHSIATAVVAQELAGVLGVEVVEEAFVAGLLHDVGKLVLSEHDPGAARDLYNEGLSGPEALNAEHATFGVTHVEVGEELARRWELPEVLRWAVARHHRHYPAPPTEPGDRLAFLVGVAESLAHPLWAGQGDPRDLAAQIARVLRKPVGPLANVLRGVPEKVETFARFFEIQLDDLKMYTLWVEGENQRLHQAFELQEEERRRTERRQAELTTIREVHGFLLDGAGPEAVLGRVLRGAQEAAGARRALLARSGGQPPVFAPVCAHGDVTPEFVGGFRLPLTEGGAAEEAIRSGQVVNVFDVRLPYFRRMLSAREIELLDAPSFAIVPIRVEGKHTGVLYADRSEGDEPFSDEEVETLRTLADLAGLAFRAS